MFILKKIGCRVFQIAFRAALPILPYREPKILPSCDALGAVFAEKKTSSVLIVTDAGIVKNRLVNAVIMPYVLESYGKCAYKKLHRLGVVAGVCNENDTHEAGAKKFIAAIKELNAKMNIPNKITGIKQEDIPEMARHAEKEANPLYPVPKLMARKELEGFYYRIGGIHEKN